MNGSTDRTARAARLSIALYVGLTALVVVGIMVTFFIGFATLGSPGDRPDLVDAATRILMWAALALAVVGPAVLLALQSKSARTTARWVGSGIAGAALLSATWVISAAMT